MGTTLTAIVEWRETGDTHPRAWWRLSTWKLGKEHALMARLAEICTRDWPSDAAERNAPQHDFHRYWTSGVDATLAMSVDDASPFATALAESLRWLMTAGDVRVLWLEI